MPFFKLSLLLLSSLSFHLALGNPSPLKPEDDVMALSNREWMWQHIAVPSAVFLKVTAWLVTVAESFVIVGSLRDTPRSPDFISVLLNALGPVQASRLTVWFLLGACLIIMGGLLRFQSFRTLGRYFTLEQCIRQDHRLITSGPYAIVRHPGYTGLLMCLVGWCIVYGSPGSWLQMSGLLDLAWVKAVVGGWCLLVPACVLTLFCRSMEEDELLSRKFGREWETWAGRVKYKLVPFVF